MRKLMLFAIGLWGVCSMVNAGEVEVLHWWTSGGEARSIEVLKQTLKAQGHQWHDFAIEGGGGESAMTVLATRAISGNPPSAAQIKGHDIQEWANLGLLADMNGIARQEHWDDYIPPVIANIMKWKGNYVAVPLNIHRVNWLWVNTALFNKYHVSIPHSLNEFYQVADQLKAHQVIPLAHGGEPWQDATLFEVVALDVLGPEQYRKAFVDLDLSVLNSAAMIKVFKNFKRLSGYVDVKSRGRDWSTTTSLFISNQAAMQVMGDWVKGELSATDKVVGKDYQCVAAFGTSGQFIYDVDSIMFFQLQEPSAIDAQNALARTVLTPDFQKIFNLNKGSIPVRNDADLTDFDLCAQTSHREFLRASEHDTLVPSLAHGMATTSYAQGAMIKVISNFFHDSNSDPVLGAYQLAKVVQAAN